MKRTVTPILPIVPLRENDRATPIRLAVDMSDIRPGGENGGVKPFVFEYVRELGRKEGTGIAFVFLTWSLSHDEVRALARPGDQLVCVREDPGTDRTALLQWRSGETAQIPPPADLLIRLRADVLYAPLGSIAFACPGVPIIATIVDLLHRDYPATLSAGDIAAREQRFADLCSRADQFQCISRYTAERLHFHYQIPLARTFCNHIVVHQRLRSGHGDSPAPADRPYFLFPANAWEHKNHLTFLVAYRRYWHQAPDRAWNLVLTGYDSAAMRSVLAAAVSLGLSDRVFYFGHLPESSFAALWERAGALVFPSLHEGFGIPLLEAMHFGVPILCSGEGSMPEVAGDAAFFVPPRNPVAIASALERMATDETLRTSLIAAGAERLKEFRLENEIETFAARIRQLARTGGSVWHQGVHADGWIEERAVFSLPARNRARSVTVRVAPLPAPRRLRFYRRELPLGGFVIPANTVFQRVLEFGPSEDPLIIECPDATNLNPADARKHGIILQQLTVSAGEDVFDLL